MNNNTKFWVRVCFYLLILAALLWTGFRAGGDPCDRCILELKDGRDLNCREMVKEYVEPRFTINSGMQGDLILNKSFDVN